MTLPAIVEELIKEGRIRGQVEGGRSEKSTFLPNIHTETQNHWIDNFFAQNNYLGTLSNIHDKLGTTFLYYYSPYKFFDQTQQTCYFRI